MSKSVRLSESWFKRGLWLIAALFAFFLVGLGDRLVANIGLAEPPPSLSDYIDPEQGKAIATQEKQAQEQAETVTEQLEQARLKAQAAANAYGSARDSHRNWLATRYVTAGSDQNAELVARTRELDRLKSIERKAQEEVEALEVARASAAALTMDAMKRREALERAAQGRWESALNAHELRIFLYRLMLTLPPLGLAAWLFATKRKGRYWPFVWGFIFFAGFVFFVELVPYLPSYGGYVRYAVGIILTGVAGRYAILGLERYLARQKEAEAKPEDQRREELGYEVAMARLAKSVCPGCERPVDLKDTGIDYCQHCGINLFDRCSKCTTRKNAFARYCFSCGTPGHRHGATAKVQ